MTKAAVEALYQKAIRELEDGDPEAREKPLSEGDHERVRAFIRAGYREGMNAGEAAALREAAVQDLLRALQFAPDDSLGDLLREVRALNEVIERITAAKQAPAQQAVAKQSAAKVS